MNKYFLIVIIFLSVSCKQQDERINNWQDDIKYLKNELPKRHKDLFFSMSKKEFKTRLDNLSGEVNELTDFEICMKLQQLIAKIGDSHTNINYKKYINRNKIIIHRFYWFKDGIYFMDPLYKHSIEKINGYPVEQIIDSLSTLITIDNNAMLKNNTLGFLQSLQILEYFGFVNPNLPQFNVENSKGKVFFTLESHNNFLSRIDSLKRLGENPKNKNWYLEIFPDSIPFTWTKRKVFFRDKYFKDSGIYYVQYNKCWSKELEEQYGDKGKAKRMPSFREFEQKVIETIDSNDITRFIFDLRFNKGGNSPQGTAFIEKLSKIDKLNREGILFVIIGRDTYSSAILNAMDFKSTTKAIFVGEETEGSPNHFGDAKSFELPKTGVIVQYSTKYFKRTENNIKTLKPDIEIEISYNDFIKGIDPVFDWIIMYK
jgi:hypothetical protein